MRKVYSFRMNEDEAKYLSYLMNKYNKSLTVCVNDSIRWFAEKKMIEESKQSILLL